jgi:hypothetical protein
MGFYPNCIIQRSEEGIKTDRAEKRLTAQGSLLRLINELINIESSIMSPQAKE